MAFALQTSLSALIPSPAGALFNFSATESVNDVMVVNTTGSDVTVSLWFDYDGTSATDTEKFISAYTVVANGVLHLTGLWVFVSGGRITGLCSTNNAATAHITKATV